jgi:hypothetical protein
MGMDVYGTKPTSERGEYFRNNVWWWRPLWDYCNYVAPDLCNTVNGDTNDGDGLDEEGAKALSLVLKVSLSDGTCEAYQANRNREIAELPNEECNLCNKTGIRTDNIGKEQGMDTKVLPDDKAIMLGRDTGWCNGCDGLGWKPHFATHYPFSKENVQEFAEFLAESGGFSIC